MVQQLRGLTALEEGWALIPSTHMAHDHLVLATKIVLASSGAGQIVVNTLHTHTDI